MGKLKSAYEIAMERASKMAEEASIDDERLDKQEEAKSLLADFFKDTIDADELWQKLQGRDEVLLEEVQLLLIDSLGLRTDGEGLKKTREGIMAVENLKDSSNIPALEQVLNQLHSLQEQYENGRKELEEQLQSAIRNGESKRQMRPVRRADGRTVMKMEAMGEETKKRFARAFSELEERASQTFTMLQEEMRRQVKEE